MIKDGIYFGMPEDEYLAEERVSKSAIKKMRVSMGDFWAESWLNPNPPELTPEQERQRHKSRVTGRAYHCAILEPKRFAATYVKEPTKADMPDGTLFTSTDMKEELKKKELKLSGAALEQALRLEESGFDRGKLWHLVLQDWEEALPADVIRLDAKVFDEIAVDGERMRSIPKIAELLADGEPEVSIFWTCPDTGIKMKCRLDWLAADHWLELKTFSNPNGKNLLQCVHDAIRYNRYHIDAVVQLQAIKAMATLDVIGKATDEQLNLVTMIIEASSDLTCNMLFQQTGGVPNILNREIELMQPNKAEEALAELKESGASAEHIARAEEFARIAKSEARPSAIHQKAKMEIKAAKEAFLAYLEIYPAGEPWLIYNPMGKTTDQDFPPFWLENV